MVGAMWFLMQNSSARAELVVASFSPWWSLPVPGILGIFRELLLTSTAIWTSHSLLLLVFYPKKWNQVTNLWGTRGSEVRQIPGTHVEEWKSLDQVSVFYMGISLKLTALEIGCRSSWMCLQPGAAVGPGGVGLLWHALTFLRASPLVRHVLLAAFVILILKFHIEFQR